MSKVSIQLPDSLHKQLRACASAEGTSIDQLISAAVAEKLAALLSPEYLETRAKRASRKKFVAALKTVPDVEPLDFDRLPNPAPQQTVQHDKSRKPRRIERPQLEESAMATQEKDQMCDNLVQKLTTGESLDDTEKSHLAQCEDCMAQVVRTLDEAAVLSEGHGLGMANGGTNGDLPHARPEAKKALEQGRRVIEREFDISLSGPREPAAELGVPPT